jgi:hypothetical protein
MFGKKKKVNVLVAPCSVCSFSGVVAYRGKTIVVEPCLCVYKEGK